MKKRYLDKNLLNIINSELSRAYPLQNKSDQQKLIDQYISLLPDNFQEVMNKQSHDFAAFGQSMVEIKVDENKKLCVKNIEVKDIYTTLSAGIPDELQ